MGRRAVTNLILCLIFGTTLAIILKIDIERSNVNPPYELASLQSSVQEKKVEHTGYTVSFNPEWRIPNWVAYELTTEEVAITISRGSDFTHDPELLYSDCPDAEDFANSGYDKGHMAPVGDMKWSEKAMKESFYMSNICPQNHNLNEGDWAELEEHIRTLATKYSHIYICCGPIVGKSPNHIGAYSFKQIVIPEAFFKVLLRQQDSTWTAIGFKMPNKSDHNALATYALSVNKLERLTGIDFFYNLPDSIEEIVEDTYKLSDWDLKMPKSMNLKKKSSPKSQKKIETKMDYVGTDGALLDVKRQDDSIEIVHALVPTIDTAITIPSSNVSSTYKGHTTYTSPRGGKYYYNSKGKK